MKLAWIALGVALLLVGAVVLALEGSLRAVGSEPFHPRGIELVEVAVSELFGVYRDATGKEVVRLTLREDHRFLEEHEVVRGPDEYDDLYGPRDYRMEGTWSLHEGTVLLEVEEVGGKPQERLTELRRTHTKFLDTASVGGRLALAQLDSTPELVLLKQDRKLTSR